MSSDYIQVNNTIDNITKIYSNAYKPFIKLRPDRYINVEDLVSDLKNRVPRWDGHASFSARNSLQDNSSFRINSFGNAYIFVSKNAKIDNIYRFYNEIVGQGVKEITLNLIPFEDKIKYEQILSHLIFPFVTVDLATRSKYGEEMRTRFSYDINTRTAKVFASLSEPTKTIIINKSIPGIKLNILFSDKIASIWYQRLRGTNNITFYCYEDCKVCRGYKVVYYGGDRQSAEGANTIMLFNKFIESTNSGHILVNIKELHKKLRPMT
jgi:hypothetical protein